MPLTHRFSCQFQLSFTELVNASEGITGISTSLITGTGSTVGRICACLLFNVNSSGRFVFTIAKHNGRARQGANNNILFHTRCPILHFRHNILKWDSNACYCARGNKLRRVLTIYNKQRAICWSYTGSTVGVDKNVFIFCLSLWNAAFIQIRCTVTLCWN